MYRLMVLTGMWPMLLAAQHEVKNPYTTADDVAAGGRIYRSHCAECHGLKGEGGRGPDLTRGEYRHGSTDAALFKTIDDGIPGTQMPGLYHEDVQLWQVVAFVRSLASTGPRHAVTGNAANGGKLFTGKGGCTGCHMVAGRGGRMGPDLTYIGTTRNPNHLRESILKPDADLPMQWWTIEATTKSGVTYKGLRLNEDTYSLQILDAKKDLVSLEKSKLTKWKMEESKSLMPAYEGRMSPAEIEDVVAYLYSLQRKARDE